MINIANYIVGITGVYLIIGALVIHTQNTMSAIIFKVIPFFLGLCNILITLKRLNII